MRQITLGESTERRLLIAYRSGVEMSILRERFGLTKSQLHIVLKRLGAYAHKPDGVGHDAISAR